MLLQKLKKKLIRKNVPKKKRREIEIAFQRYLSLLLCRYAATGSVDEARKGAMVMTYGSLITTSLVKDMWEDIREANNITKRSSVQFPGAEWTVASQLQAYMNPFEKLYDAQPSDVARRWIADKKCLNELKGYIRNSDDERNYCAWGINVILGTGEAVAILESIGFVCTQ